MLMGQSIFTKRAQPHTPQAVIIKFDTLMIEPNRKYQWIQEVHHSIQLKHSTITTDKSVSRIVSYTPMFGVFGIQTRQQASKVVQLISGSWEQWWLNPHGGTSCLWTCLCSPEEPSSCLYQSLVPETQATSVHKWAKHTGQGNNTEATRMCQCGHIPQSTSP